MRLKLNQLIVNLIMICLFTICSCNKKNEANVTNLESSKHRDEKTVGLKGTWIAHTNEGFKVLEVQDYSNVYFSEFIDRKFRQKSASNDRYFYFKSKAKLDVTNDSTISILTDKFRFDYKVKNDTLFEFDKMGTQAKLIKIH